jgi:hypothetical protein
MKRFIVTRIGQVNSAGTTNYQVLTVNLPIFPSTNMGFSTASFTMYDFFSYLRFAYLGCRGSIRKRVRLSNNQIQRSGDHVKVNLDDPNSTSATFSFNATVTPAAFPDMVGGVSFVPATNGGIEFELPLYTNNLHLLSSNTSLIPTGDFQYDPLFYRNYTVVIDTNSAYQTGQFFEESAAGEDFSFLRFQGTTYFTNSQVF